MKLVLVETNWVIAVSAPAHHRISAAVALLDAAARGEVTIHVPSFCFSEAKPSVREKQPRREADAIREYLRYRREHGGSAGDLSSSPCKPPAVRDLASCELASDFATQLLGVLCAAQPTGRFLSPESFEPVRGQGQLVDRGALASMAEEPTGQVRAIDIFFRRPEDHRRLLRQTSWHDDAHNQ